MMVPVAWPRVKKASASLFAAEKKHHPHVLLFHMNRLSPGVKSQVALPALEASGNRISVSFS